MLVSKIDAQFYVLVSKIDAQFYVLVSKIDAQFYVLVSKIGKNWGSNSHIQSLFVLNVITGWLTYWNDFYEYKIAIAFLYNIYSGLQIFCCLQMQHHTSRLEFWIVRNNMSRPKSGHLLPDYSLLTSSNIHFEVFTQNSLIIWILLFSFINWLGNILTYVCPKQFFFVRSEQE